MSTSSRESRSASVQRKDSHHQQKNERDQTKMFVGGLPSDYSKQQLTEYFSNCGNIRDSFIVKKQTFSFGFITFQDEKGLQNGLKMNQSEIQGRKISCNIAKPRVEPATKPKECFTCGKKGHFARDCRSKLKSSAPEKEKTEKRKKREQTPPKRKRHRRNRSESQSSVSSSSSSSSSGSSDKYRRIHNKKKAKRYISSSSSSEKIRKRSSRKAKKDKKHRKSKSGKKEKKQKKRLVSSESE